MYYFFFCFDTDFYQCLIFLHSIYILTTSRLTINLKHINLNVTIKIGWDGKRSTIQLGVGV